MRRSTICLAALLGCGAPTPQPTPAPTPVPAAPAASACPERVAVLAQVLAQIPDAAIEQNLHPLRQKPLPTSSRGAAGPVAAVPLILRADGRFELDGLNLFAEPPFVAAAVQDALAGALARARGARPTPDEPTPDPALPPSPDELRAHDVRLAFALDPAAPVAPLVALLGAMTVAPTMELQVRDPATPPAEDALPPAVRARLGELRADRSTKPALPRLTSCPQILELNPSTGDRRMSSYLRRWFKALPDAVAACACEATDVEGLAALAWLRTEPSRPLLRALPFAAARDAEPLTLPPDARAADLVAAVEARGDRPFTLALQP